MAKLKFTNLELEGIAPLRTLTDLFHADKRFGEAQSGGEVVLTDDRGHQLVFRGEGLVFAGGVFTGGTVDRILVTNAEGEVYADATKVNRDAVDLFKALDKNDDTRSMFTKVVLNNKDTIIASDEGMTINGGNGNDVMIGGDGIDAIFGDRGNDRLTGNDDMDIFMFFKGEGKDVITDFDPSGGFGRQDFIGTTSRMFDNAEIEKSGKKNTLIDFAGKDDILLLGVKPKQIDESDFMFA